MEQQQLKIKLFVLVSLILFSNCNSFYFNNNLHDILGITDTEISDKYNVEDIAGLGGEGMIFERYKLSDKTIQKFQRKVVKNNKSSFKSKVLLWEKTPVDTMYNEPLSMVVDYNTSNKRMQKAIKEIEHLIFKSNVYYAFLYEENKDHVICFFIDIDSNILYAIDQKI